MTTQKFLKSNSTNTLKSKSEVFAQSVPDVFFNTCFDKNQLKTLTAWFLEKYGEKFTVDFLETLKQVGFHQATLAGVSLGIDDLQIPPQKPRLLSQALVKLGDLSNASHAGTITSVEKSQRLIDTWNQTSESLRQTAVQNFRVTNPVNPVFMMAFSGARGNISQVRQLVAMRGLMADPQGAILEFPIQSNFREGLTITEYLISCYGARKGLVDTALRTATSGYLTRRLVDAVQHVVVVMTDCKTKRGVLIKNKNVEQRLLGRVLLEDLVLNSTTVIEKNTLISQSLAKLLALNYQEIYVRSPLTCTTEKSVCQLCYGLNLAQGKLVSIGEAVGVIAAQSIGEPGTQLTMRTFHTGGVGVFSDQAMKSFNAPFDGKIEFLEALPGLFVRTPHGNIVYLLKYSENAVTKPILRLKSVNGTQEVYEIPQSHVPSGSLLWVKQGEYVRAGQLLVQASQIKTSKQQMPESSHPVQAPYAGEVFFESMTIRVITKETKSKAKKKAKKEDDVSPKFRTLTQLGNFWVFSSGVQKEYSIFKSFFVKGDLVSSDTPILQYNLHIPKKAQLKRVNSSLVLGQNCFEFLASKSYYCGLSYFLLRSDSQKQKTLLAYTYNPKKGLFTWYPSAKNLQGRNSGYCSIISNGSDPGPQKVSTVIDGTLHNAVSQNREAPNQMSLFWSEHQVFNFKSFHLLGQTSCFLVTPLVFSKKGTFQIEFHEKIKWSKKTLFPCKFLKNFPEMEQIFRSNFLKKALNSSQSPLCTNSKTRAIQKKQGWFYVPEKQLTGPVPSQFNSILLEPGKKFEKMSFLNSPVSVNFLQTENLTFFKSKATKKRRGSFYSPEALLGSKKNFNTKKSFFLSEEKESKGRLQVVIFSKNFSTQFCFYKIKLDSNFKRNHLTFKIKRKRQLGNVLFLQKNSGQCIPDRRSLKQNWFLQKTPPTRFSTKSPLFTKQISTQFGHTRPPQSRFTLVTPCVSGWGSAQTVVKIEIQVKSESSPSRFQKFRSSFQLDSPKLKSRVTGFRFMFYDVLNLKNSTQFSFKTFDAGWVLPEFKVTGAFIKSKLLGEFRHLQINQKSNSFGVLRNTDIITLKSPLHHFKIESFKIGAIVRWGQEIFPGFAVPVSGQVLKITAKTLTIRRGIPILASARGVVHVFNSDLIQKKDLLITLKSRRLQTEDIVQGIPKIEQLFEARETQGGEIIPNSAHTKLQSFFEIAVHSKPLKVAVNQSIHQTQLFLVENILEAYSNQGVTISEKHVEIVVRQMTARVRILSGGDTGLLPGELVQLKWVEGVNTRLARLGSRQARYEPLILGITKSVLQSESFLVAASFQEVSRVLVRSALAKKTDFLRGLHENVILGQLIPAGTGVVSRKVFDDTSTLVLEKPDSDEREVL